MWSLVPSFNAVLQGLACAFTHPSFFAHSQIFLGWVMCLGYRTEFRVFEAIGGRRVSRQRRHPCDRFYNFFIRSAWTVRDLAHQVAVQLVVVLQPLGELHLIVDATLLHKRGKHVFAIGWFHDPVASTKKRVATAQGNKWVVLGLAVCIPGTAKMLCLPIHAKLHPPGKGKTGEAELARQMLEDRPRLPVLSSAVLCPMKYPLTNSNRDRSPSGLRHSEFIRHWVFRHSSLPAAYFASRHFKHAAPAADSPQ